MNISERNGSSAEKECRICYDDTNRNSMISPCNCSGSMKYVHKQCLLSWVNTTHNVNCDVCNVQYNCHFIMRRPHLWTYIRQDLHQLMADFLIIIHFCFVMICSQIIAFYVMNLIFKHKCLSSNPIDRFVDILCKVLIVKLMVTTTALNTFCLIVFIREFRQLFIDGWNQLTEYSIED